MMLSGSSELFILTISNKRKSTLKQEVSQYYDFLKNIDSQALQDALYTKNVFKSHEKYRACIYASSYEQFMQQLSQYESIAVENTPLAKPDIWFFSDANDGHTESFLMDLMYESPALREIINACLSHLTTVNKSTLSIFTCSFITQYAAGKLAMQLGLKPRYFSGVGLGAMVAAVLTDALSLEEALFLVASYRDSSDYPTPVAYIDLLQTASLTHPLMVRIQDEWIECLNNNDPIGLFNIETDILVIQEKADALSSCTVWQWGVDEFSHVFKTRCATNTYVINWDKNLWTGFCRLLSECYLSGMEVQWRALYTHGIFKKIKLPGRYSERAEYFPSTAMSPLAESSLPKAEDLFSELNHGVESKALKLLNDALHTILRVLLNHPEDYRLDPD
ncbi:MAG: hypothetical protein CK426_09300, partial [Legionella sp.]